MKNPAHTPRATYRVQMHAGFTFAQLEEIVPYLHQLGISDVYTSPIFKAAPGSQHGYDVCDPNEVNPELGGQEGLLRVSAALRERGMGLLVDFVPNHMGIEGLGNWRWLDVLANGHESRYARYFDINWHPRNALQAEGILVPMLGDFYGRILEKGELKLVYEDSSFWVAYGPLRFPLRPASYATILERLAWYKRPGTPISLRLEELAERFRKTSRATEEAPGAGPRACGDGGDLRKQLAQLLVKEGMRPDLDAILAGLNGNPSQPNSFDQLHRILEEQNYRLAYWRAGAHEINYRRFFAVDTLVAVRMELAEVFDDLHRQLLFLIEKGVITGVRVDHIDGLWDPAHYLDRLAALGGRQEDPVYLLVEKILTTNEQLPGDWAVHGTTGYDFAASLVDLLVAPENEPAFTRIYQQFAGVLDAPENLAYRAKQFIIDELFSNAIDLLVLDLAAGVKLDRRWRDLTVNDLRLALARIIACLPVYRTYWRVGQEKPVPADANVVERATAEAMRRNAAADPTPMQFIADIWLGRYPGDEANAEQRRWADRWICKLQQFTGAMMAKSIEDTFFYRFVRLFATNEVGHHPADFGRDPVVFHQGNQARFQHWPASMLASSTHDTKVSEDVRARLCVLSHLPERWAEGLAAWSEANHRFKTQVGATLAPDPNEEYLLYQILLGAWPLEGAVDDLFRERIRAYLRKALSEAKSNTNWANPNEAWLKAAEDFSDAILDPARAPEFWRTFLPFAQDLARRGGEASLVQTALKLTCPGVPDIYQGTELWDLSLVDPDNRRPVDYPCRKELLAEVQQTSIAELSRHWETGGVKLRLINRLLTFRHGQPKLFSHGAYRPVALQGAGANSYLAFLREDSAHHLLIVVRCRWAEPLPGEATLVLPELATAAWRDLITDRRHAPAACLPVPDLLVDLPVAILLAEKETAAPLSLS